MADVVQFPRTFFSAPQLYLGGEDGDGDWRSEIVDFDSGQGLLASDGWPLLPIYLQGFEAVCTGPYRIWDDGDGSSHGWDAEGERSMALSRKRFVASQIEAAIRKSDIAFFWSADSGDDGFALELGIARGANKIVVLATRSGIGASWLACELADLVIKADTPAEAIATVLRLYAIYGSDTASWREAA